MADPMRAAAVAMRGGPGGGQHCPAPPPPPPPAPPAAKRRQHCTFCKNHGVTKRKNGHVCKYKDCKCLLCQLTTFAQMAMRHQQAWWRHQGREMAKNKNLQVLGFSSRQLCDKCRNHNEFFKKRGHKTNCKYEACDCRLCNLTDKRRLVMKHQQRVRRANVTSHEEPASDDDDADSDGNNNQSSSREDNDLSQEQENHYEEGTNTHDIVEAINAVTKAIDALPDTHAGMSSLSSRAAASARPRQNARSAASCRPPPPPPTTLRHHPAGSSSMPLDYPHPAIPIETAQHHQQRGSPQIPSYSQQLPIGFPSYPPSPVEERAPVSGSVQNSRPWERDRVSPTSPSFHQKPKFSPYAPRTTSPPKAAPVEPAIITIKKEVKDEAPWSPVEADMASLPSPPSGLMGQQRPSYLSNFPTSLGSNSLSTMSPPSGLNNGAPLHQKPSPLNQFHSSMTNLEKVGGFNPNPANHVSLSQFEASVSNNRMEEESDVAASVRLLRSEVGDSSGASSGIPTYGSGYVPTSNGNTLLQRAAGDSEFSLSRAMPPGALEGLHLFTKMVERRFPEHFQTTTEGTGYYPPPQSASAGHQPIPGFFRAHPHGVMNHHASVLQNPVQQPCPVRLFPANFQWNRNFLPGYHSPFSMLNPDPFLSSYSSALLSRPNRNS